MSTSTERDDLQDVLEFLTRRFDDWRQRGLLTDAQAEEVRLYYEGMRGQAGKGLPDAFNLRPADQCWSCRETVGPAEEYCDACGAPVHNPAAKSLRYLNLLCHEVRKHEKAGRIPLSAAHACLDQANGQIVALRRKLDQDRAPMAVPAGPEPPLAEPAPEPRPRPRRPRAEEPAAPRRNLLEIILDPRNIQWLLVSGGILLVLGLVIWLYAAGIFENPRVLATLMGAGTAALLFGGWAVFTATRYQMAGRALTLLACLVMPFNLWFYDAQGLITLAEGGHLWIPALICCVLYALSARVLRDPVLVVVLVAGVAGTGLLILADHDVNRFWEITTPAAFLVGMALVCIHVERAFPPVPEDGEESPFSRRRFGLAFFFSGHALLAAGLLLLLGAQLSGGWLYEPVFKPLYDHFNKGPAEVAVTFNGKLLALALVLLGTYAYAYSDAVVRRVGVYVFLAIFTLLWAEVLVITMVEWPLPTVELAILALAVTAFLANRILTTFVERDSPLLRVGPALAFLLCAVTVLLGVFLHFSATALRGAPGAYDLGWSYFGVMLLTALACRDGAFVYRERSPSLATTYHFATGAAVLLAAAGFLVAFNPDLTWDRQAWLLMLIPLVYLSVSRLYRGMGVSAAQPLAWVAHAATVVMLVSSVGAAFEGFLSVQGQALNLWLALFFAEAMLFYLLDSLWSDHPVSVYLGTAMACAAVWQLLKYFHGVDEYYTLVFAVVGLLLLVVYRFSLLGEKGEKAGFTRAAFGAGNALLTLAFAAAFLMTLGQLVAREAQREVLVPLLALLLACGLAAVVLVRAPLWRRWYLCVTVGDVAMLVLVLAILGTLTPAQKLEVVCVVIGLILLVGGHIGWYREQEHHSDMVTLSLTFGSLLVTVPLFIAVYYCRLAGRDFDAFHATNEIGMLVAGLALLATGYMLRIMSTTLGGAVLTVGYLVGLVLFLRVPERLQTTAVYIMVGGGLLFGTGLLLSLYRDRLLVLPERIRRREGIFRVLTWR